MGDLTVMNKRIGKLVLCLAISLGGTTALFHSTTQAAPAGELVLYWMVIHYLFQ